MPSKADLGKRADQGEGEEVLVWMEMLLLIEFFIQSRKQPDTYTVPQIIDLFNLVLSILSQTTFRGFKQNFFLVLRGDAGA